MTASVDLELPFVDPSIGRRVLVADDDLLSSRLLMRRLEGWGYEVTLTHDGAEALEILEADGAPRLALLDWMMPGLDGPEICRRLRERACDTYAYLILVSARTDQADVVAGLDSGADDFVKKPFDLEELRVRLRNGRRVVSLQAEVVAAREAFRRQASSDALTGLRNRRATLQRLHEELARCGRKAPNAAGPAVILFDVDHFKSINDRYGHAAGDDVLCEIARRTLAQVREYDLVGRYGGEEFMVLLPEADLNTACAVAERVRASLADAPFTCGHHVLPVTASFGVMACRAGDDQTRSIAAADEALYAAKAAGRNRVRAAGRARPLAKAA